MSLSQARCKDLWEYDALTGLFWSKRYTGKCVGSTTDAGYVVIEADGKQYLAHRLAWLYSYGTLPVGIKGVCPTGKGTYRAYVNRHKKMYQAYFSTVEAAQEWVINKRAELHGAFTRN